MRKYLQTPGLLSVSLKTALSFSLAFILMLFSASALAAGSDHRYTPPDRHHRTHPALTVGRHRCLLRRDGWRKKADSAGTA